MHTAHHSRHHLRANTRHNSLYSSQQTELPKAPPKHTSLKHASLKQPVQLSGCQTSRPVLSEGEVCAALVEHVLLAVDQKHAVAQVAAPAVLGAVHLLVQRKANVSRVLLVGLQGGGRIMAAAASRRGRAVG